MNRNQAKLLNGQALAYMGDSVFENKVREHLLCLGYTKVNDLHRLATHYVSAKAQASFVDMWLTEGFLEREEINIYKRGRNAKIHTKAKNTDHATYAKATGFEALIGYLYLTGASERLTELIDWCLKRGQEAMNE